MWFRGSQSTSIGGSAARKPKHWRSCCRLAHKLRWLLITPLGALVDPEVNKNLAIVSGRVGRVGRVGRCQRRPGLGEQQGIARHMRECSTAPWLSRSTRSARSSPAQNHTHAEVSCWNRLDSCGEEYHRAVDKYFGSDRRPTIDETIAHYREKKIGLVMFTVDSESQLRRRRIPNEEICVAARKNSDMMVAFASIDPHQG